MSARFLLIGATGMLGKAFKDVASSSGYEIIGLARSGTDINIDITNSDDFSTVLEKINPEIILNTAAIVNLDYCEKNPGHAYLVNTRPSSILANFCEKEGCYLIHISSDHFYSGDLNQKHSEDSHIRLLNEYARTKYLAEKFVELCLKSLIIRTNILGFKDIEKSKTFLDGIICSLQTGKKISLFDDYYTSPIDVHSFSKIILDLIEKKVCGKVNVGSQEVISKKDFILKFAFSFGLDTSYCQTGSIRELTGLKRGESLGLDVSKVEGILGYNMPTIDEVIRNLYFQYMKGSHNEF